MSEYHVKTENINENLRIRVEYDRYYDNPASDWDGESKVWWFDKYGRCTFAGKATGDNIKECRIESTEVLRTLCEKYVTDKQLLELVKSHNELRFCYDKSSHEWNLEAVYDSRYGKSWECLESFSPRDYHQFSSDVREAVLNNLDDEDMEHLLSECNDIAVRFDAIDGVHYSIMLTDMAVRKVCWGEDAEWDKEWAERHIDGCVDTQCRYANGDVYGYFLEERVNKHVALTRPGETEPYEEYDDDEWNEVESVWNFYCDPDELIEDVKQQHNIAA